MEKYFEYKCSSGFNFDSFFVWVLLLRLYMKCNSLF